MLNKKIILILVVGLILRLIGSNQSLWLDEAAQVLESTRPLNQQLNIQGDFQPPLFHILLHFWLYLGNSEVIMRLLTISLSVAGIYLFYNIVKKISSENTAVIASTLLAINPFAVFYSQELRPYPLTLMLVLLLVVAYLYKKQLLYILTIALLLYSTYFAPFFIIALVAHVVLLSPKNTKWVLINTAIGSLFFLPWVPYFIKQLNTGVSLSHSLPGWDTAVSLPLYKTIPLLFAKFYLGRITIDNKIIYALVVAVLIAVFVINYYLQLKKSSLKLYHSLFTIPLILAFITHLFIPVFDPKRLIFILPFFILILAVSVEKISKLKLFTMTTIVVTSLYGLTLYYINPRFQRENWKEAISFVEQNGDGNQIAIFAFPEPFAPYLWYQNDKIEAVGIAKEFVIKDSELESLERIIMGKSRVFYFQYLTDLTDPQKKVPERLENLGYTNTQTYDFSGVGLIFQYDKPQGFAEYQRLPYKNLTLLTI